MQSPLVSPVPVAILLVDVPARFQPAEGCRQRVVASSGATSKASAKLSFHVVRHGEDAVTIEARMTVDEFGINQLPYCYLTKEGAAALG